MAVDVVFKFTARENFMKILAIDGNSIINRAFYGIKLLTTKSGLYTNGVYGFMSILNRLLEAENPDGVVVAFDLHAPTFRHKEYSEYKAGRKGMPDELRSQMPLLKKLLTLFGYTCLEMEGFEADDILGTLAAACEESGNTCVIATGDRDSFQLVSDSTKVLLSATKMGRPEITAYTPETIFEKYGVKPLQMIEIKALQGDSSDNIPGVPGVGEKTADELIKSFGSVDYIYEHLEELDIRESLRAKLSAGKDSAYLSRFLGTINREVPIDRNVESYKTGERQDSELAKMLSELEFFSMLEKLGLSAVENAPVEVRTKTYSAASEFEVLGNAQKNKACDVLFSGDSLLVVSGETVAESDLDTFSGVLSDANIEKRVYDSKLLHKACIDKGISVNNVTFDTVLAAYLINPSSSEYSLSRLSEEYLIPTPEGLDEHLRQAALSSEIMDKLSGVLSETAQDKLLHDIEIPLARVLAEMEHEGFLVDTDAIVSYGNTLGQRIDQLQSSIYSEVGYEFNLNSPKQLGVALFEKLGLPCKKKTKSGYSTNAEVLEELKALHPAVEHLLEYRTLSKLKSTYCEGLSAVVSSDGRIHSTLNQTETRTGRISSSEPNLQNIPVRRPEGRELRRFFKAKDGYVLCDADYSQIELRVLAHIADDKNMINAFLSDTDIHTLTASEVFNMPVNMVTPQMRSSAKAVNFGIVYGIGAYSLAKDIGVSNKEAAAYIKGYLETYPEVDAYMHRVVERAKENGFAETVFGRRRLLPELKSSNGMLRSFGERVARNMPIQGTAADIIKIAMIRVFDRLKKEIPEAALIMQVHDELIVEAPESKAEAAAQILKEEMENAVQLKVPMTVDAHWGKTWYDAKG